MSPLKEHDDVEGQISEKEWEHANVSNLEVVASEGATDARLRLFSEEEQKRLFRRIDRRLVLTLGFMYCVSLMDRTNLGLAAIGGMVVDLELVGSRYSIITLVFFITYVLLQPIATVAIRKVGPQRFLPTITLLWGIVMVCHNSSDRQYPTKSV
jgi:sugar phosphate permease